MSILNNSLLLGADAAAGGYQISRSVRFNSSDSAYLGATFGTPTDQDVFTLSMWVKRSALGSTQHLFGVSTNHSFGFTSGDALNLTFGGSSALTTTALFRDPSAWYHIMWVQNGTAHTLYVNGTSAGTATATSNTFNTAVAHQISAGNTANFFNGYLAYVHFIDGQAKSPSAFGADDENGTWQPLVYAGGYGNNGFQLEMDDNSTTAALGTDTSSNGNDWTVNNLSVTAGADNDSLVDSPTNYGTDTGAGGEVRGNYATLNPLIYGGSISAPTNGNLDVSSSTAYGTIYATIGVNSGKWYWEFTNTSTGSNGSCVGISAAGATLSSDAGAYSKGYIYCSGALKANNNSYASYGASWNTNGDIIGIAFDADNGTLTFYKNGSTQGQAYSGIASTSEFYFPVFADANGANSGGGSFNFGQVSPFAYTAPSGFTALCTTNLAEGTITTSGTFTGNASADGPFVYLNGVPTAMTINSNAVTFATHADKLSNGFKLRTSSGSYNTAGSNTYSITTTGAKFKFARAQPNP
jgi:hypothetical protein